MSVVRAHTTLVTGAGGFLGRSVMRCLASESGTGRVIGCLRSRNRPTSWPCNVDLVHVNLDHSDAVARLRTALPAGSEQQSVQIIHLAGEYLSDSPSAIFDSNVVSTVNLLEALGDRVHHVVYASSVSVYGSNSPSAGRVAPDTGYGEAKWLAECSLDLFRRSTGVAVSVLRLASLYGPENPGNNAVAALTAAIAESKPFTIRSARLHSRDYMHIEDAARAVIAARRYVGTLDIGTGIPSSPYDLVDAAREAGVSVVVKDSSGGASVVPFAVDPTPAQKALGLATPVAIGAGIMDELSWRRQSQTDCQAQ